LPPWKGGRKKEKGKGERERDKKEQREEGREGRREGGDRRRIATLSKIKTPHHKLKRAPTTKTKRRRSREKEGSKAVH